MHHKCSMKICFDLDKKINSIRQKGSDFPYVIKNKPMYSGRCRDMGSKAQQIRMGSWPAKQRLLLYNLLSFFSSCFTSSKIPNNWKRYFWSTVMPFSFSELTFMAFPSLQTRFFEKKFPVSFQQ